MENSILNESSEAIPLFFNDDDVIFTFDFPQEVVLFGQKINQMKISHEDYEYFMEDLNTNYKDMDMNKLKMHISSYKITQVCAALYENTWRRAIIKSKPARGFIKVLFIDEDKTAIIETNKVKYLMDTFGY